MIWYMYILWGDCHCKNLTILKCTIQLYLVVGQPSLLSSPKHVHHTKRKPCTTEESLTICPLPQTTSPGKPLVCFLFLWIWLFWTSLMPSSPTGLQILGVRELTLVNKVFTGINSLVLSFIILSGFIKGDLQNWKLTEQDYTLNISGSTDTSRLEGFSWPL